MHGVQVRDLLQRTDGRYEVEQMLCRAAVSSDGIERRAADMLMMCEPAVTERGKGDRLEAQRTRGTGLQLAINLGSHRAGRLLVGTDPRLAALLLFKIGEVPHPPAQESPNTTNTKGRKFRGHNWLRSE